MFKQIFYKLKNRNVVILGPNGDRNFQENVSLEACGEIPHISEKCLYIKVVSVIEYFVYLCTIALVAYLLIFDSLLWLIYLVPLFLPIVLLFYPIIVLPDWLKRRYVLKQTKKAYGLKIKNLYICDICRGWGLVDVHYSWHSGYDRVWSYPGVYKCQPIFKSKFIKHECPRCKGIGLTIENRKRRLSFFNESLSAYYEMNGKMDLEKFKEENKTLLERLTQEESYKASEWINVFPADAVPKSKNDFGSSKRFKIFNRFLSYLRLKLK